jgi:hypothetical protein
MKLIKVMLVYIQYPRRMKGRTMGRTASSAMVLQSPYF